MTAIAGVVVKVGGGLLGIPGALATVLDALRSARATGARFVVVPGGGPFADAVRQAQPMLGIGDDAAHWMAILGMDQLAHALADRLPGAVLVADRDALARGLDEGAIPVLAPSAWLRAADPLPHGWHVTSDSIAAWVAAQLGASRLVLVKPASRPLAEVVDGYFEAALGEGTEVTVLAAADAATLPALLGA